MTKRVLLLAALLMVAAGVAQAGHLTGKIQTVRGDTLVIQAPVHGVKWVAVGKTVKLDKKIKAVVIAVADSMVTVVAPKAEKLKVGEKVEIKKARRVMSGC